MVKKRLNSAIRRTQIINAARRLVVHYGSEHVTISRIASEVGISEGNIYRHFKSKSEVLSGLVDCIAEDLFLDSTNVLKSNSSSLEYIDSTLNKHLSIIEQKRGVPFQVIAEIISFGDKNLNMKVSIVVKKYINGLKHLLFEGIKSGEVRRDIDVDAAATMLFGMIQGLTNIWALNNYDFNLQKRYSKLWQVFLISIARGADDLSAIESRV
jgi:TetR/AcrR family transcriptional regulator, fatty acid metabolism regulator protein